MSLAISIREYTSNDLDNVLSVFDSNSPQYFAIEEREDLIRYLNHEIETYFVAEVDDNIVGCGGINMDSKKKLGIISWGMIHANQHKKGIGMKLLKHRISELKKLKEISSIVVRTSQLVYPFYEKNGFEIDFIKRDYWAEGLDLYQMNYKN